MTRTPPPGHQPSNKIFLRIAGLLVFGGLGSLFLVYGLEGIVSGSIDVRVKTDILYRAFRDGEHHVAYWIYTALAVISGSFLSALGLCFVFKRRPEVKLTR